MTTKRTVGGQGVCCRLCVRGLEHSDIFYILFEYLNKTSAVGWVNLCQKLEIEKNTVCGKVISPKK